MNQFFSQTIWLVPCYSLIGIFISILWFPSLIGRTGPRPAGYIHILLTFFALVHSLGALSETWNQPPQYISFNWLQGAGLQINWDLEISSVTVGALILITALNLAAQIYAIGYLEMDWGWARFFALTGLFEAGMCTFVLSDSLFFSYVLLEILTLGTYLLIGFWFNQSLVVTGARDAFLTKRVGDLFLLMGVVALLPLAGTWNYNELGEWAATADLNPTTASLLCLTLIAGPVGKCAQLPLHLWLDEAMEGPMPATILRNSLIVCTGAWVLIKLQPVFTISNVASVTMITIGALTAVICSFIAIAQIDIKRSLSYTVSAYMGLLFIAIGTQQHEATLILLLTYAIAMALLIMSIGGVVLNNITQDLTQYGGLWSRRPISAICYLVGAASLVAFPPLGSFFPLAEIANNLKEISPLLMGVLLLVDGLTAFSLTREFLLIFAGKPKPMTYRSPEGLWPLVLPMVVVMGFALHLPLLMQQWHLLPEIDSLNTTITMALIGSTLIGVSLSSFIYLNDKIVKPIQLKPKAIQDFFAYDLYTVQIYRFTIVLVVSAVSKLIYWFDRYLVDGVVNLVGLATIFSGEGLKYNVSGQGQFYILSIITAIALFILTVTFPFLTTL